MITIQQLKQRSRSDMREVKPSVYRGAILFVIVSLVLSILLSNLTGEAQFAKNMRNFMDDITPTINTYQGEELFKAVDSYMEEHSYEIYNLYPRVSPVAYLLAAVVFLMSCLVSAGFDLYCLKISRRQDTKAMDVFTGFEFFGKIVSIILLKTIFVALWSLLFVIPGIIAYYRYSQSFYLMYDHPEYSPMQCILESSKLMRGHKGMLFVLQLSFIGWFLLDNLVAMVIIVPVLSIFVYPYFSVTCAHFYNVLSHPVSQGGSNDGDSI